MATPLDIPRKDPVTAPPISSGTARATIELDDLDRYAVTLRNTEHGLGEYMAALGLESEFIDLIVTWLIDAVTERIRHRDSAKWARIVNAKALHVRGVGITTWASHRKPESPGKAYGAIAAEVGKRLAERLGLAPGQAEVSFQVDHNIIAARFAEPVTTILS